MHSLTGVMPAACRPAVKVATCVASWLAISEKRKRTQSGLRARRERQHTESNARYASSSLTSLRLQMHQHCTSGDRDGRTRPRGAQASERLLRGGRSAFRTEFCGDVNVQFKMTPSMFEPEVEPEPELAPEPELDPPLLRVSMGELAARPTSANDENRVLKCMANLFE